jgi:hypothetical protein
LYHFDACIISMLSSNAAVIEPYHLRLSPIT